MQNKEPLLVYWEDPAKGKTSWALLSTQLPATPTPRQEPEQRERSGKLEDTNLLLLFKGESQTP